MIVKAALLLFRGEGKDRQLMFVRAKGRPFFIFPGGKQEQYETIEQALDRELYEELGVEVAHSDRLGKVGGQTPDGRDMEMHLYTGEILGEPRPLAEISEIVWMNRVDIKERNREMTPMTLQHILPFLEKRHIWQ